MKAKEGRKKSIRALVAIGNGKGAAGTCVHCKRCQIYLSVTGRPSDLKGFFIPQKEQKEN